MQGPHRARVDTPRERERERETEGGINLFAFELSPIARRSYLPEKIYMYIYIHIMSSSRGINLEVVARPPCSEGLFGVGTDERRRRQRILREEPLPSRKACEFGDGSQCYSRTVSGCL